MSKLINCRLSRIDSSPWGFRLQGGKDFGTPLIVQKVHGNSLAEKAGLMAGDAIVRVNGTDIYNLKHKEAQDIIVRAGNSFELTVSRGGSTWKPQVTVLNNKPVNGGSHYVSPMTKTSLEYHPNNGDNQEFCSGHNSVPKPFSPVNQINGTIDRKKLMSKQYNSPVPLYSDKTIAETLSAQAEVLETGALGVNFKKNERSYDSTNSEVYKMVQEEYQYQDKEFDESSRNLHHCNNNTNHYTNNVPGIRSVSAPETKFIPTSSSIPTNHNNANTQLPPGQNICADCERLIVGVFVRIKDKNLHVECFKCATCGSSLKNVGYYNINDKLYCDVHAKMIARNNPPAPNLIPITISPYDKSASNMVENIKSSTRSTQSPGSTSPSSVYSSSYQQTKYSSSTLPRNQNVNNCSSMNNNNMCYQNQNSSSTVTKSYSHTSSLQKASTISSRTSEANSEECYSSDNNSNSNNFVSKSECPLLKSELEELALRYRNLKLNPEFAKKPNDDDFISSIISDIRNISTPKQITSLTNITKSCRASPLIPAYQENIVPTEQEAIISTNYDPRSRSVTPSNTSGGTKSPAAGPPPNPLILLKPHDEKFANFTDSPMLVSDNIAMRHTALLQQLNSDFFDTKLFNFSNYQTSGVTNSLSNVVTKTESNTGTGLNNINCSTGRQSAAVGTAPKRGKGIFNANIGPGARTPQCAHCRSFIRGPFISALGKIWCPEHFTCTKPSCKRQLQDLGFVEDNGQLYCEFCFEQYLAPSCAKCRGKIKGDCLKAIGKHFHPECFACTHCGRQFGNSPFFLEDNLPYCENDWNQLFTTKCFSCGFPVEAGDRWVEALGNNYHSQCFNCTMCKKNLEGQSFFAKSGRPYCKQHAH